MGDYPLSKLLDGGSFFEDPRWRDGRWWVSDFYTHLVQTVDPDGRAETVLEVENQPSGLGWMPDGSLLVVSMRDHRILRRSPDGEVTEHADVSEHCGGHLNDMVVDANGRAYCGNFGFDLMGGGFPATTNLIRVDPDGSSSVAADDLYFPNGSVPGSRTPEPPRCHHDGCPPRPLAGPRASRSVGPRGLSLPDVPRPHRPDDGRRGGRSFDVGNFAPLPPAMAVTRRFFRKPGEMPRG